MNVPANPRIEALRRRVDTDPASIAFAQLAEEHRRAGSYDEAVAACRSGLAVHPGFVSARVTLGRALIEISQLDAAELELEQVLKAAPENLAALRGLGVIHRRRGNPAEALSFYRAALALAIHDPELEQTVDELSRAISPVSGVATDARDEQGEDTEFAGAAEPPALPELERFLGAIHTYRQRRAV